MAPESFLSVSVLVSTAARKVQVVTLQLPPGATVRDALRLSRLLPDADATTELLSPLSVGVWGRRCNLEQVLRDLDRVELYRPLRVDPKVARRQRFAKQGARTTGLFARRRVGAQSGY